MLRLDDFRLRLGVLQPFLVAALRIVAHELEEERDLVGLAFGADALDEGVLRVVDGGVFEWGCSRSGS